jgi:hypothetical protein
LDYLNLTHIGNVQGKRMSFGFQLIFKNRRRYIIGCLAVILSGLLGLSAARADNPFELSLTLSGNDLVITFPTGAGAAYELDGSTNLLTWGPVQTGIQGSGTMATVVVTNGLLNSCRFFRVTVLAPVASDLALSSGDGQTGVAGTALASPLAVLVTDNQNNPVSGVTVSWTVTAGGGSVGSTNSITSGSGIATNMATLGSTGGANTFQAAVNGLTGSPVTFSAVAAKNIAVYSGNNQRVIMYGSVSIAVLVADNAGNPVPGITVHWSAVTSGGSVSPSTSTTSSDGIAATTATVGRGFIFTFRATVSGLTGSPVSFSEYVL